MYAVSSHAISWLNILTRLFKNMLSAVRKIGRFCVGTMLLYCFSGVSKFNDESGAKIHETFQLHALELNGEFDV